MRRLAGALSGLVIGYAAGVAVGAALVAAFSTNAHDKSQELVMTAAFVTGPIGAVLGAILGAWRSRGGAQGGCVEPRGGGGCLTSAPEARALAVAPASLERRVPRSAMRHTSRRCPLPKLLPAFAHASDRARVSPSSHEKPLRQAQSREPSVLLFW